MYFLIITLLLILLFLLSKNSFTFRKPLIIIDALVCCIYIIWRLTVIPLNNGFLSAFLGIILFLAELMGLFSFFNLYLVKNTN